mmetsp:Transcript_22912/g.32753  ORF Transcript_22912/g.32753 Transcript_22912/m.32753 type:complete len:288 (-) Transcript_22912:56-919(-)
MTDLFGNFSNISAGYLRARVFCEFICRIICTMLTGERFASCNLIRCRTPARRGFAQSFHAFWTPAWLLTHINNTFISNSILIVFLYSFQGDKLFVEWPLNWLVVKSIQKKLVLVYGILASQLHISVLPFLEMMHKRIIHIFHVFDIMRVCVIQRARVCRRYNALINFTLPPSTDPIIRPFAVSRSAEVVDKSSACGSSSLFNQSREIVNGSSIFEVLSCVVAVSIKDADVAKRYVAWKVIPHVILQPHQFLCREVLHRVAIVSFVVRGMSNRDAMPFPDSQIFAVMI